MITYKIKLDKSYTHSMISTREEIIKITNRLKNIPFVDFVIDFNNINFISMSALQELRHQIEEIEKPFLLTKRDVYLINLNSDIKKLWDNLDKVRDSMNNIKNISIKTANLKDLLKNSNRSIY